MSQHEETQKMNALLKEYELVELEIDNRLQHLSTMGSLFVTALGIFVGFIIVDEEYELLLIIPFFLFITSVYLLNHKRTVIFDLVCANQIEDKINDLLRGDQTIYFGHMCLPMEKARSPLEWVVIIVSSLLYIVSLCVGYLYATADDTTGGISDTLPPPTLITDNFNIVIILYIIFLILLTLYYAIIPADVLKRWSEELEAQFEKTESKRENLDLSKLDTCYLLKSKYKCIRKVHDAYTKCQKSTPKTGNRLISWSRCLLRTWKKR